MPEGRVAVGEAFPNRFKVRAPGPARAFAGSDLAQGQVVPFTREGAVVFPGTRLASRPTLRRQAVEIPDLIADVYG